MNKIIVPLLFLCIVASVTCQPNVEKLYKLNFSNFHFTAKGIVKNSLENGEWEVYNFMNTSFEFGEFKNGLRYGDWVESKGNYHNVTNWAIHEDTTFKMKISLPYKFDTLEIGDFYYAIVYSNHSFLDNIVISVNNPTDTLLNIDSIHIANEIFFAEKKKTYQVVRSQLSDDSHNAYLDEYVMSDISKKEYYLLLFYTKLKNGKLLEIKITGRNLVETKKIFYKMIMNCFLEGERVFNPFVMK